MVYVDYIFKSIFIRCGEMRNTTFISGNVKGRDHAEELDVDGKTMLEFSLGK